MSVSFSSIVQRPKLRPIVELGKSVKDAIVRRAPTVLSQLSNGLRLSCASTAANLPNDMAVIGLFINCGTKSENYRNNGSNRALELCSLYATESRTHEQLVKAVNEIGGHLHVETGREQTVMLFKCLSRHVGKAVALLADIAYHGSVTDVTLGTAKQRLAHLREELELSPDEAVVSNLFSCAFDAAESGLGMPINGTERGMQEVNADTLREFRRTHWMPKYMSIVGTGAVNIKELEQHAQEHFGSFQNQEVIQKHILLSPHTRFVGGDFLSLHRRMNTWHCAWGFQSAHPNSPDCVPLNIVRHMFGCYHRSQYDFASNAMYRALRGVPGPVQAPMPKEVIESVSPFMYSHDDGSLIGLHLVGHSGCGASSYVKEALRETVKEWARIAHGPITEIEVEQAKAAYKTEVLMQQEGNTNLCLEIGRHLLYYRTHLSVRDLFERIDDCTSDNVQEVLDHYTSARAPVLSVFGNVSEAPSYTDIKTWVRTRW